MRSPARAGSRPRPSPWHGRGPPWGCRHSHSRPPSSLPSAVSLSCERRSLPQPVNSLLLPRTPSPRCSPLARGTSVPVVHSRQSSPSPWQPPPCPPARARGRLPQSAPMTMTSRRRQRPPHPHCGVSAAACIESSCGGARNWDETHILYTPSHPFGASVPPRMPPPRCFRASLGQRWPPAAAALAHPASPVARHPDLDPPHGRTLPDVRLCPAGPVVPAVR